MKKTYNQRLFGSPFTKFLHESRFHWVKNALNKHKNKSDFSIIELGCLDARIFKYIPLESINYYYGIDAGWDGYTKKAIDKYKDFNNIEFLISTNAEDISTKKNIDTAIAMQVFEYIPEEQYSLYIKKFSAVGCNNLYLTVSNERGLFMIMKLLIKKLLGKGVASYSLKEIGYLLTGKMDKIERVNGSMKGFDYQVLIQEVNKTYDIQKIVGLPFPRLPLSLNFTIAIHGIQK